MKIEKDNFKRLERINRMNVYVKKTHDNFLKNIKLSDDINGSGVLAGKILKEIK